MTTSDANHKLYVIIKFLTVAHSQVLCCKTGIHMRQHSMICFSKNQLIYPHSKIIILSLAMFLLYNEEASKTCRG